MKKPSNKLLPLFFSFALIACASPAVTTSSLTQEESPLESSGGSSYIEILPSEVTDGHVHEFADYWEFDDDCHWQPALCGHEDAVTRIPHSFGEPIVYETTIDQRGYELYACSVCGYKKEVPLVGEKFAINYDLDGGTNAPENPGYFSEEDEDFILKEPFMEGAAFVGWTGSGIEVPTKKVLIKKGSLGNRSYKAHWFRSAQIKNNADIPEPQEGESYTRFCTLEIGEDKVFVLAFFTVYGSGYVSCEADAGLVEPTGNGEVIRLRFSDPEIPDLFVVPNGNGYSFTDEFGTPISEIGNEDLPEIDIENVVEPYGESLYGYASLNRFDNAESYQKIYNLIHEKADLLSQDENDWEDFTFLEFSPREYGLTMMEAFVPFKFFLLDHPEYYFIDQTAKGSDDSLTLFLDKGCAKANYRQKIDTGFALIVEDCALHLTEGESDLQRYLAIHDYVASLIDYAYEEDGVTPESAHWAHSIIGTVDQKFGVCEAYAETYYLLCRHYGLESIQVDGKIAVTNGAHVWNLGKIDGQYYSIDVTWDDAGAGKETTHEFFGGSYADTIMHKVANTPKDVAADCLYPIPRMATTSLQLVYVRKEEGARTLCKNFDDALAKIDDEEASYTINLFQYEMGSGPLLLSGPSVDFVSEAEDWPKAEKITVLGAHYDLGGGYYTSSRIVLPDKTSFHSDVDLGYLYMRGSGEIHFEDFTVTFVANCQVDNVFKAPKGTLAIDIRLETTDRVVHAYGKDNEVKDLNLRNGNFQVYNPWHIGTLRYQGGVFSIYFNTGKAEISLSIDRWEIYDPWQTTLGIQSGEGAKVHLAVGDIIDCTDESIEEKGKITIMEHFDSDNANSDIQITGHVDENLPIQVFLLGSVTYLLTDLDGNDIGTETRYANLDQGLTVLTAPSLPLTQVTFYDGSGSSPIEVTKNEGGAFVLTKTVIGELSV